MVEYLKEKGANVVGKFDRIRLYQTPPNEPEERQFSALVYDVPENGLSASEAMKIVRATQSYRQRTDDKDPTIWVRYATGEGSECSFKPRYEPKSDFKRLRRAVPNSSIIVFVGSVGDLETTTINALKESLQKN